MRCCVPGCVNASSKAGTTKQAEDVSFFKLPSDPKLLKAFLRRLKLDQEKNFQVTRTTRVCSNHYSSNDFYVSAGKRELKPGVLSSVFGPKTYTKKPNILQEFVSSNNPEVSLPREEENASQTYKIVGEGHTDCFSELLSIWWANENFTNVIFYCSGNQNPVRANASVLAASSSLLGKLLMNFSGLEEDAVIVLPDYSRIALSCVLQYIYTGKMSIKAKDEQVQEICSLMKEFDIKYAPKTSENNVIHINLKYNLPKTIRGGLNVALVNKIPESRPVEPIKTQRKSMNRPMGKFSVGSGIDCLRMNPAAVNIPVTLPNGVCEKPGTVEKETLLSQTLESAVFGSSGFSYTQCFSLETKHRSTVVIGNYEPYTVFQYDPSPVYLNEVPKKQYKRKLLTETATPGKRTKLQAKEKLHVGSNLGPAVQFSQDSIFADEGDVPQTQTEQKKPKKTKTKSAVVEEPMEKLEADCENACALLSEEIKRRNKLRRQVAGMKSVIERMKKWFTLPADEDVKVARKKKSSRGKRSSVLIPCDECGKMVKEYYLSRHKRHHKAPEYCCDKCGRTFFHRGQLNSHYRLQHVDLISENGGFPCTVCGQVFKIARYLKRHMTLHTGEKRYLCKYCGRRFRTDKVYTIHVRTHTGEKPYKCTICEKAFARRYALNCHIKSHEKKKNKLRTSTPKTLPRFQCDECPAKFRWETYLIAHKAKHTGEAPVLPCEFCQKVFTSFNALRNHRKEFHPSKTILCDICGKQFLTKGCYYRHRRKHKNKKISPAETDEPVERVELLDQTQGDNVFTVEVVDETADN